MRCMIIVPHELLATANAFAASIDPTSIGDAFAKPLRLVGTTEVSHWYAGPNLTDQPVIDAIRQMTSGELFVASGGIYYECDPLFTRASFLGLIEANGLEEIPEEVEGLGPSA